MPLHSKEKITGISGNYSLLSKGESELKFTAELPVSKSIANRLLIMQALGGNLKSMQNQNNLPDDVAVLYECLHSKSTNLNSADAGTAARFLTAFLSVQENKVFVLDGSVRMRQRPMNILIEALRELGADIICNESEGFLPLTIKGRKLKGGSLQINASVSSQYSSALLMIAPCMEKGLELLLEGKISSEPYIRMTLELMKIQGINSVFENNKISISPQKYSISAYEPERDWSAASYFYELASFSESCEIFLNGLTKNSLQGDAVIAEIMQSFGVATHYTNTGIRLSKKGSFVKEFSYDFTDFPDLTQTIAVCCAGLHIPAKLYGLHSLRIKETDRITALKNELEKLGVSVRAGDDFIEIMPGTLMPSAINTYGDHRMAMAFAPLALLMENIKIENSAVVSKSFPSFWEEMEKAGIIINRNH